MTFLCWNINRRPVEKLVAELVRSEEVDVVILLECAIGVGEILKALNQATGEAFYFVPSRITVSASEIASRAIFTRFPREFVRAVEEGARYGFYRVSAPAQAEILLAVVHFPSKLHWKDASQALECTELASTTAAVEDREGLDRTVLVGDLNMNPFESGMVGAAGLNATMARRRALRDSRTVQGKSYRFFYNPMWGHLGDRLGSIPGTYHYDNSEQVTYFWNMFDQVLVRPNLIPCLDDDRIQIVERVGLVPLLTADGIPDRRVGSDHLPLLFSLRL